jgi:Bacterial capsule synthesis protein PGA_cap
MENSVIGSAVIDSSVRLRELINQKRQQGQLTSALTLAKIGRRVVLQAEHILSRDEASRKAFELYLEFEPNDQDVKQALDELLKALLQKPVNQNLNKPNRFFTKGLYGLASIFGLSLVGGLIYFSMNSNAGVSQAGAKVKISQATQSQQTHSSIRSLAASSVVSSVSSSLAIATDTIIIRAVGDVVLGTDYPKTKLPDADQQKRIIESSQSLVHADVAFGNLEGVLADEGKPRKDIGKSGYYSFRMPTSYARILKEMGFNVLSVANNHSLDFGSDGLQSTLKALHAHSLTTSGAAQSGAAVLDVRGTKIAFLSYSYLTHFTAMDNEPQIALDIAKAKQQANLVLVSVHAGAEGEAAGGMPAADEYFMREYRGNIRKFSEFVIDAGASGVFGHGPHVVRPFEIYKQKPIFYSLGNFIGFRTLSTKGKLAQSIIAEVRFNPDGTFLGAGIIPLKMDKDGIPSADYSLQTLNSLDDLLNEDLAKQPPLLLLKTH